MKEIGGYFELEFSDRGHYHNSAIALNSARNCLRYILKAKRPSKCYLPAYCCNSLIEPLLSEGIEYDFYHIDHEYEIIDLPALDCSEKILYINYFSLKRDYVKFLATHYHDALIIDNTQAFFEKRLPGIDTFYSARKFFGVPDGGFLYTDIILSTILEQDESISRFSHLLGRIESDASSYYERYKSSEASLIHQPIKYMSKLTSSVLRTVNYEMTSCLRQRNFLFLHSFLKHQNLSDVPDIGDATPMVYPLKLKDLSVRERLLKNKIYTASYWPDALYRVNESEKIFIDHFLYLPIDQRYNLNDLSRILEVLNAK